MGPQRSKGFGFISPEEMHTLETLEIAARTEVEEAHDRVEQAKAKFEALRDGSSQVEKAYAEAFYLEVVQPACYAVLNAFTGGAYPLNDDTCEAELAAWHRWSSRNKPLALRGSKVTSWNFFDGQMVNHLGSVRVFLAPRQGWDANSLLCNQRLLISVAVASPYKAREDVPIDDFGDVGHLLWQNRAVDRMGSACIPLNRTGWQGIEGQETFEAPHVEVVFPRVCFTIDVTEMGIPEIKQSVHRLLAPTAQGLVAFDKAVGKTSEGAWYQDLLDSIKGVE